MHLQSEYTPLQTAMPGSSYLYVRACRSILLHTCRALEKLTTPEEGAPSMEVLQLRAELFKKLGWHHWEKQEQDKIRTHFPPAFPLF